MNLKTIPEQRSLNFSHCLFGRKSLPVFNSSFPSYMLWLLPCITSSGTAEKNLALQGSSSLPVISEEDFVPHIIYWMNRFICTGLNSDTSRCWIHSTDSIAVSPGQFSTAVPITLPFSAEKRSLTSRVFCKDSVRLRSSFFSSSTPLRERAVSSSSLKKQKWWQLLQGNTSPAHSDCAGCGLLTQDLLLVAGMGTVRQEFQTGVCLTWKHHTLNTLQASRDETVPPDG